LVTKCCLPLSILVSLVRPSTRYSVVSIFYAAGLSTCFEQSQPAKIWMKNISVPFGPVGIGNHLCIWSIRLQASPAQSEQLSASWKRWFSEVKQDANTGKFSVDNKTTRRCHLVLKAEHFLWVASSLWEAYSHPWDKWLFPVFRFGVYSAGKFYRGLERGKQFTSHTCWMWGPSSSNIPLIPAKKKECSPQKAQNANDSEWVQ
jgi:hypothetical protein